MASAWAAVAALVLCATTTPIVLALRLHEEHARGHVQVVECVNATHYKYTHSHSAPPSVAAGQGAPVPRSCGAGFSCVPLPVASCVSDKGIAGHTPKTATYEIISSMPAKQLQHCTRNATVTDSLTHIHQCYAPSMRFISAMPHPCGSVPDYAPKGMGVFTRNAR